MAPGHSGSADHIGGIGDAGMLIEPSNAGGLVLRCSDDERAILVSGDAHLTILADRVPVRTPAEFMASLDEPRSSERAP